ncbi:uncharacterized protein M421DRAFT_2499 [Didymella exigua CBS 183.55]|uniref:Secreted protein n=1 Tax=Didymella exigua CBS 183.55 TaxID=1150837 RepID=A0A6A5RX12_9PLEO|nr:uncharacterized protein M421DRAFT_2499 [Didymella exigua CBS 183.55]KAF1931880.1 hypothetical protein M421DRAFT_2499 [Didymella exigua CBS 183.55]
MKCITTILALAGVVVLADLTDQGEAETVCGSCDYGGVGQQLIANSPQCSQLNKLGGWSIGRCINLDCRICMFFKDYDCKSIDLSWAPHGSPYFSAAQFNSYSCVA